MNVGFEAEARVEARRPRLRILHCLRAPVGGLFRHVCDLSAELADRGHDVGVVCDADGGDALTAPRLRQLEGRLSLGLFRVAMSREIGPADVTAYRTIRDHVKKLGVDVVHGHGAKGGAYARLVARALKKRGHDIACFYTPHGGSLHYRPSTPAGRIYMTMERLLARATDAIVFESAYAANRYAAQAGSPPCATRVIPNGLAPGDFRPVEPTPSAADFLFVGELRRLKGVDVLLEAIAQIAAVRPVRAVIVGGGPDAEAFKAQARALGIDACVTFPGPMPAAEAFRLGRTLVVPSRAESFPYIVLEAAAGGLPVIATDVGGIPEIVAGTGMRLLAPEDAHGLVQAMLGVMDDPKAAQERSQHLRESVALRFTVSAMTDGILDLYGRFAKRNAGADG